MSKPLRISVLHELISACSSLNMYPDTGGDKYLSECDSNAKHSYEHIEASMDVIQEIRKDILLLKQAIMREDIPNERKYAFNDKINSIMERF